MESRWCRLALIAQARGALDFGSPETFDWRWILKERMVLGVIEDELVADVNKLAHHWHCSAAQVTGWDEQEALFEHHKKQARRAYNIIGRNRLPWYKDWEVSEEKSLDVLWKEFRERGKDPEYAKYLHSLREELRDMAREGEARTTAFEELLKRHAEAKAKREAQVRRRRR